MSFRSSIKPTAVSLAQRILRDRLFWDYGGHADRRAVYLTFDDGPDPRHHNMILEILNSSAKASFFMVGNLVHRYPELVRCRIQEGHSVGNHGLTHTHPNTLGVAKYIRELKDTETLLRRATGDAKGRYLVRPPYGDLGVAATMATLALGWRIAMWSLNSQDSYTNSADAVIGAVLARDLRPGEIVLMHEDCEHTIAALPAIVSGLVDRGFELRALA